MGVPDEIPDDETIDSQYGRALQVSEDAKRFSETKREEVERAQLMLDRRLVYEIGEFRKSMDRYTQASRWLTFVLIAASILTLAIQLYQTLPL